MTPSKQAIRPCTLLFLCLIALLCVPIDFLDAQPRTITVYEDKNYRGKRKTFGVGRFNKGSLNPVGNDKISSVRVPAGMRVTLYEHDGYRGKTLTLTQNAPDIHRLGFGDKTSSLSVQRMTVPPPPPPPPVARITIYEDKGYRGSRKSFAVGRFNKNALSPVGNDKISSVRIPASLEVTLYEHDTYRGKNVTLTQSTADVHHLGFGDNVSSLIVHRRPPATYRSGLPLSTDIVPANTLKILTGPAKRYASRSQLPCNCHIQGIGWNPETRHTVITCQDLCSPKRGAYLLLYPNTSSRAAHVVRARANTKYNHPSSIQVFQGIFPVAMADGKTDHSFIEFYAIQNNRLRYLSGRNIIVRNRHIGALAYTVIGNNTYMVGAGWDAKDLTFWQAPGRRATSGFRQTAYAANATSLILRGIDNNWGAYNSLWLGRLSNGKIVLIATHGGLGSPRSWLDIWEVFNLGRSNVRLQKIAKKWMGRKGTKNVFFEGVTLRVTGSRLQDIHILAAPHDYGTTGCPANTRCTRGVYDVIAIK